MDREVHVWTDATFIDCVTMASSAQAIVMRPANENLPYDVATNPLVKKIGDDRALTSFASWILCFDALARFEAFSTYDFSGQSGFSIQRPEFFDIVDRNQRLDIDALLTVFAATGTVAVGPDCGLRNVLAYAMMRVPRGTAPVISYEGNNRIPRGQVGPDGHVVPGTERIVTEPDMYRSPGPTGSYSSAGAAARTAKLNAARVIRQAANVSSDAGLGATISANWTAARAANLATAQAMYPGRGYV
ncbi:MAG TPA: hypothetical protein VHP33_10390 [Polyangiaceae bacterium]|nr:hypothetical protein [Polyangiaceae bacterium]